MTNSNDNRVPTSPSKALQKQPGAPWSGVIRYSNHVFTSCFLPYASPSKVWWITFFLKQRKEPTAKQNADTLLVTPSKHNETSTKL